jgi:UDP-glucose 4-epimerase
MIVLATGGAGFIGSHLADALIERGDLVTVIDDLSSGRRANLEAALAAGAELLEGDVLDPDFVMDVATGLRPDAIVHFAAQGEVRRSIDEPAFDATANVVGTINMLEAGRAAGTERFVLASTGGAIYGEGEDIDLPAAESAPMAPLCPYGLSKLAAEQYLDLYRRMYGSGSVALRFANVYGPRQNPKGEAGVVAIFCELLLSGDRPVVFGDGGQTRDYVFIDDVIEAVLAATTGEVQGPVNIGTGVETGLMDLIARIAAAAAGTGIEPAGFEPGFEPARPGEVRRIAVDPSRARQELGWQATTSLEQGLLKTLEALLPGR